MTDSCSLTPPVSPGCSNEKCNTLPKELSSFAKIPYFSCRTSVSCGLFNEHGDYLKDGYFYKLLEKKKIFDNLPAALLLFNKPYAVETALWSDGRKLFLLAKRHFGIIRSFVLPNNVFKINEDEIFKMRMHLCNLFAFIKDFLIKLYLKSASESQISNHVKQVHFFLTNFITELKKLLLFTGRLCHIPEIVLNNISVHDSVNLFVYYQYYHTCLDLWWSAIEILYLVCNFCDCVYLNCSNDSMHALRNECNIYLDEMINNIVIDLCSNAARHFKQSSMFSDSATPFTCPCTKQFWIQLILLINKCQESQNKKSFWTLIYDIIQYSFSDKIIGNENLYSNNASYNVFHLKCNELSEKAEYFLWFTYHITPLCNYDFYGNCDGLKKPMSFYLIPKYIIDRSLNHESMNNELCLRKILSYLFVLVKEWEPKGDVLLLLTDFFIKKIDDSFCKSKLNIQDISYIFKTSNCWLNHIKSIVFDNTKPQITENSFQIYLRILSVQLSKSGVDSSLYRQIKGRIFSKFTSKRLKELTEIGLQNCFSVFLTVALSINLEEMASKMCEFASLIQSIPSSNKKQQVAWKALFVLLFAYQEQGKNLEKIASKAVQLFNNSCTKYASSIKDHKVQSDAMNLILLYVENMNDIFENSRDLLWSEHLLIGSGFSSLLPMCTNEINYLLTAFLNISSKFSNIVKGDIIKYSETHYIMLLQSLFNYVFPFVKSHVLTNTPPNQLADLAAAFTFLSIKFSRSLSDVVSHTYVDLFKYFANAPNVNPSISARYLNFVLNDLYVVENLKCTVDDFSSTLMQSLLKCCISIVPPCDQTQELTKYVFQMKEITTMFPEIKNVSHTCGMYDFLCIRFFKIMGDTFQNCTSLSEKNFMKEKVQLYFFNIPSLISSKMKHSSSSYFTYLYKLMSHLMEYCSPLLYAKYNQNNVLPKLVDVLLFPHVMFPKEKYLTATLSRPIKENLILFITGLLKLDYRNEPYVKRILKSIIVHYVDNFSHKNNPISTVCISAASQNAFPLDHNAFCYVFSTLKDHILSNFNSHANTGFKFLAEIIRRIPSACQKKIFQLFTKDLLILFLKFDGIMLNPVKDFLSVLFVSLQKETDRSYKKQFLHPLCESFITENLAWAQFKVFRILDYLSEYFADEIRELIPFIIKHIEYVEGQRGSGIDVALRKELKALTDKLHVTRTAMSL